MSEVKKTPIVTPSATPRVLTRNIIPTLTQNLDASDVMECYALVRATPLHGIANSTLTIQKMSIGVRYRPSGSVHKEPVELTLEYGSQRLGPMLHHEAMPFIQVDESSSFIAWDNVGKIYYTTKIVNDHYLSSYYMASMTGAVLNKILGQAVEYAERRRRYQPFAVFSAENGKELRSSSSTDFTHFMWQRLANLGVEIEPILPPPQYEARLWVESWTKVVPEPAVAMAAATFYQNLYQCLEAIATNDYGAWTPSASPTISPVPTPAPTLILMPSSKPSSLTTNEEDIGDDSVNKNGETVVVNSMATTPPSVGDISTPNNATASDTNSTAQPSTKDETENVEESSEGKSDSGTSQPLQDDQAKSEASQSNKENGEDNPDGASGAGEERGGRDADEHKLDDDGDKLLRYRRALNENPGAIEKAGVLAASANDIDNLVVAPEDTDDLVVNSDDTDDLVVRPDDTGDDLVVHSDDIDDLVVGSDGDEGITIEDVAGVNTTKIEGTSVDIKAGDESDSVGKTDGKSDARDDETTGHPASPSPTPTEAEFPANNAVPSSGQDLEVEKAKQAAKNAQIAADQAKQAAQTEGETKAADAAQAAADAAQAAADATSNAATQVAMDGILGGDGSVMSSIVTTCLTNPQYEIASIDENGTLTTEVYLYRDGSLYYKLNLAHPYLEIAKVNRPFPKPVLPSEYGSGGDLVDWVLAMCFLGAIILMVLVILQQMGHRCIDSLFTCQKWFFNPRKYDYEGNALCEIEEESVYQFGEDGIPLSMGGRLTQVSPIRYQTVRHGEPVMVHDPELRLPALSNSAPQTPLPVHSDGAGSASFGDVELSRLPPISRRQRTDSSDTASDESIGNEETGVPERFTRDPDFVDLPHLKSTSKVAVPVGSNGAC